MDVDADVDADAEAEEDGDAINAAACGWSWGCSVNPIVADAAAATAALVTNETNTMVSNIFVVVRMILDALKLFSPLKNIVPTDIRSFLSPPAKEKRGREQFNQNGMQTVWKKERLKYCPVSSARKHYDKR